MKMNQDMDKIKVLLVEDEQTLAMIIKDTLEGQNFIIHTAADGEEGLRMFFDLRPDVLVADVMMPRMDGFEMVRHIRQTDKRTPVLFLTARSSINDVVEGFELGANDYLKKPFGMQELIVRIKALVGKAFTFREEPKKEETCFEIGDYHFNSVTQILSHTGIEHKVDMYICGHIHNFQHIRRPGSDIDYIVNSAGSLARKVKPTEGTVFCNPEPGFSVVSADKKELTLRMIDKKGNILHTISRKK